MLRHYFRLSQNHFLPHVFCSPFLIWDLMSSWSSKDNCRLGDKNLTCTRKVLPSSFGVGQPPDKVLYNITPRNVSLSHPYSSFFVRPLLVPPIPIGSLFETFHLPQPLYVSGFGGLVASMLASGTRVHGFKPGRSRRIFRAKNPQHAFLRRGSKAVCPMSQLCGM
jgi:hypothetical protein